MEKRIIKWLYRYKRFLKMTREETLIYKYLKDTSDEEGTSIKTINDIVKNTSINKPKDYIIHIIDNMKGMNYIDYELVYNLKRQPIKFHVNRKC